MCGHRQLQAALRKPQNASCTSNEDQYRLVYRSDNGKINYTDMKVYIFCVILVVCVGVLSAVRLLRLQLLNSATCVQD